MLQSIAGAYTNGLLSSIINGTESGALSLAILISGIILSLLIGYVLGSLNFALILSAKMYKDDIRNYGSKNAGTTNMMRTYGNKAAGLTILGDALKAVVAVVIGSFLMGVMHGGYVAALGCVLGHVFPVFYRFKGGKGVATAAAAILVLNPFAFLIVLGVFILCVVCTRYVSLGSVLGAALFPLLTYYSCYGGEKILAGSGFAFICAFIIAALVIIKHHANLSRLAAGKESKFSFKKSKK